MDDRFEAAKRHYAEAFGDAIVTSTYLKVAVLAVSMAACMSACVGCAAITAVQDFKPLVVRIDKVGKADVVAYDDFRYKPQENEVKYFLAEFCRLYYGRNRYTVQPNFERALFFLDPELGGVVARAWQADETIAKYLQNVPADIDIDVKQIVIEDLRRAPYKATVYFEAIYYQPVERLERKRVPYVANFVFAFRDQVPGDMLLANPLGMAITYFREDAAVS